MLKFLIGPVLMGTGYAAGSYYGRDAEQLVHKSPSVTYAAVEQAIANAGDHGTTSFEGGTPTPYELTVDRTYNQHLVLDILFAGQQGAQAELTFTPQADGKDTLITARMHGDRAVLRTALAGTSNARLAYAPDWMLNLTVRPLLQQLAQQIEQDQPASLGGGPTQADAEAQWEANLSADQRQQVSAWQQQQATRPSVDPNAAAAQGGQSN